MKKSTLLATAVLAGAIAQPAFAQDSNPDYFNGVYVGGTLSVVLGGASREEGLQQPHALAICSTERDVKR